MDEVSMSTSSKDYGIRLATENDSEAILEHLRVFFFKNEPLNQSVKLIEFEDSSCIELEQLCMDTLLEGHSLIAVTGTDKVIGVCLNGIAKKVTNRDECLNPKFAKLLKFWDYIEPKVEEAIFQRFQETGKTIAVKILSTDSACRGQGIATKLMDRCRIVGREIGCSFMRVDCSSYFSARAIAKLGFDCVYEISYSDYKENGKPVFETDYPHTSETIYVQKIR